MKPFKEESPAEKRRAYMREYQRKRRAEKRLAKMTGEEAAPTIQATKKITRKRTRSILDDDSLIPLSEWDTRGYQLGTLALEKAEQALAGIEPESLRPIDIKRLVDLGIKLRTNCGPGIATEETEEEQLIVTDDMLGSDEAIDAVNALLRISAASELNEDLDRQEACLDEPGGLREGGESGDVDTV